MTKFIDRVPASINLEIRLLAEAIAFASAMLQSSMNRLRNTALTVVSRDLVKFTREERFLAFTDAWSIVDQTYNLQKLFASKKHIDLAAADQFIRQTASATILRNGMDHLSNNLRNLARTKKAIGPVFGTITFAWAEPGDVVEGEIRSLKIVMETASRFHHKVSISTAGSGKAPLEPPCDHFVLHAFGKSLDLSLTARTATRLTEEVSLKMERAFARKAKRTSEEKGITLEKLYTPAQAMETGLILIKKN